MSPATLAALNPLDHVLNHPYWVKDGWWLWSSTQGNLVISGIICCLGGLWVAKHVATGPESLGNERYITRHPIAHMIELVMIWLREANVRPVLGERTDRFMPMLWTLFFFILVNNLLGLIPIIDLLHLVSGSLRERHAAPLGGTATQNLWVTGALALVAFFVINVAGLKQLGVRGYLQHLTAGAPAYVWPILIPVEIAGIFIKPIALAIRLFANMTAGHTLIATFLMFVTMSAGAHIVLFGLITPVSFVAIFLIYCLELFIALLQAYVFMFLVAVFVAQLAHDHDHEHDEGHGAAHAEAAAAH